MIFDGKVVAIAFFIFISHSIHLRLQNENYYQSSVIHRVDTNASTAPMMANFEVVCIWKTILRQILKLLALVTNCKTQTEKPFHFVNFLLQ